MYLNSVLKEFKIYKEMKNNNFYNILNIQTDLKHDVYKYIPI